MNKKDIIVKSNKYKINPIIHSWIDDVDLVLDAVEDFGYGGVVTNVSGKDGFTSNPDNVKRLSVVTEKLRERGLEYWIYDEVGYPSGQANGLTLDGHPELKAKGMYMRKFEAFLTPEKLVYTADETADGIVYAVKYKMDLSDNVEAKILFDTAEPLDFDGKTVNIDLKAGEIAYVFIVRDGYEGTHSVHNVSSRKKYINIMSEEAVDRFLKVAYDPIYDCDKNIYGGSRAVFTDEPSLMTALARPFETFNYALIPYEKTLFDKFRARYGFDLEPLLPLLYEDTNPRSFELRQKFYELIGEVVAANYSGKINAYCKAHGTLFSGHYLAEENVYEHVMDYGNYVKVLENTGYAGMDILQVTPEDFFFTAPKFLQMIARKKNSDGYMVELCPFFNADVFRLAPFENAVGSLGILLLFGARKIQTYYEPRLGDYDPLLARYGGSTNRDQSRYLNSYVAGICTALEGKKAKFDNYVYYAIEDVQAKFVPTNSGRYERDSFLTKYDRSLRDLCRETFLNGGEFGMADADDILSGIDGRIIVPEIDYIRADVAEKLKTRDVTFIGARPAILGTGERVTFGKVKTLSETVRDLCRKKGDLELPSGVIRQTYDGAVAAYNNNKSKVTIKALRSAYIYDPDRGSGREVKSDEEITLMSYRAVVAFFD